MLLTSKSTIAEISEKSGFNDYNYFTRAFTKRYGIAPTKLRKEQQTNLVNQPEEF